MDDRVDGWITDELMNV